MELEKLLKLGIEYLSDYFGILFSTIRNPRTQFPPKRSIEEIGIIPGCDAQVNNTRLDPKLLSFLLISIFIGSVFNTNIPGRNQTPDFVSSTIIIIGYWFLFSSLVHLICRTFGGAGGFIQTLSVNLQVLAMIHVLSSFITFLWAVVIKGIGPGKIELLLQAHIPRALIESPIYAYFLVQFILVLVYLPLANRRVHGLRFWKLNRVISNRVLALALSRAEAALFYVVFLFLSIAIAEVSKTNYHIHNVPLSQPDISRDLLADSGNESGTQVFGEGLEDSDDMIVVADVFSNGEASLADLVWGPRDLQRLKDFEKALHQDSAREPFTSSFDHNPQTMRVVITP